MPKRSARYAAGVLKCCSTDLTDEEGTLRTILCSLLLAPSRP